MSATNGGPSSDERPAGGVDARRVDLPAIRAGFAEPPPCHVHLKFLPLDSGWMLVILTAPGMPVHVARWLRPFAPATVEIGPGVAPKVLRAHFHRLPAAWKWMLSEVSVHYLELTPDGAASMFVHDSLEHVQRFVAAIPGDPDDIRERRAHSGAEQVKLTPRQAEVLSLAVALGYYEMPHKLNLRTLARRLDMSLGAVCELLRRGESLIVKHYVDSLSASRWEESEPDAQARERDA